MLNGYRDLIVYTKAYELSISIYYLSTEFPKEETYSLTSQIRRSSRSVAANICEAWAKRTYRKAFINKLTDSLGESNETEHWLKTAYDIGYIEEEKCLNLLGRCQEVQKMLASMIRKPDKFLSNH